MRYAKMYFISLKNDNETVSNCSSAIASLGMVHLQNTIYQYTIYQIEIYMKRWNATID